MSRCERCGQTGGDIAESERLGQLVCYACAQSGYTKAERAEFAQVWRRREIAIAIRGAATGASEALERKLRDRALLIETASDAGEVEVLIRECEALGLTFEGDLR